jgi:hypothetical protein
MKSYGYTEENSITPEDVAKSMVDLVTDGKYGGGTCLQTSVGEVRPLGTWNIEPPKASGTKISQEGKDKNYVPILEKLKRERGD